MMIWKKVYLMSPIVILIMNLMNNLLKVKKVF